MFVDPNQSPSGLSDLQISLRQFVGGLDAVLNDQSYAGADGMVVNPSGRFLSVGPYGSAVEGQPFAVTQAGGVALSPSVTMILLGAAAFWLLSKHAG